MTELDPYLPQPQRQERQRPAPGCGRSLSGEKFAYEGAHWQIREPTEIYPKPIQKPHPSFYMVAVSPVSYEYAAKFGISLLRSPQFTNLGTAAEAFDGYRRIMLDQGFDADAMDQPFSVRTFVALTDEEAKAETKDVVWFYHLLATLLPGALGRPARATGYENNPRDPSKLSKVTAEDVWERVVGQMKRYMHKVRATSFQHQMRIGGLQHKKVMGSRELHAKHVMPELREEEMRMSAVAV